MSDRLRSSPSKQLIKSTFQDIPGEPQGEVTASRPWLGCMAEQPARQPKHEACATFGEGIGWGALLERTTCANFCGGGLALNLSYISFWNFGWNFFSSPYVMYTLYLCNYKKFLPEFPTAPKKKVSIHQ